MSTSVSYQRKRTNHTFHLLMTVLTFGFWGLFIWIPMILWNKFGPREKVVTHHEE